VQSPEPADALGGIVLPGQFNELSTDGLMTQSIRMLLLVRTE
jgi:hypothetical protein